MRGPIIAIAALALGACAAAPPKPAPRLGLPLLAPSTLGTSRSAQQVLHAKYGDQVSTLSAVLQVTPAQLRVIALNAVGIRVFTLVYDGVSVQAETVPGLPEQIDPERVLADLQLALWPLPALRAVALGSPWEVTEPADGTRLLKHGGKLFADVRYEGGSPWNGKLTLTNHTFGYSLTVESRPLESRP